MGPHSPAAKSTLSALPRRRAGAARETGSTGDGQEGVGGREGALPHKGDGVLAAKPKGLLGNLGQSAYTET